MPHETLLIATGNAGKRREIKQVLDSVGLQLQLTDLSAFPNLLEPVEDAPDFAGNARLKALYYAKHTRLLTLADDSGLEVDSLGGEPGVHSARYAGLPCDDAANNAKLIGALANIPQSERAARFVCYMVLAENDKILAEMVGRIEGQIIFQPRGQNGFGYDPLFLIPSLGKTTAELPPEHKNQISHRGQASRQMALRLGQLISQGSEIRSQKSAGTDNE